ncbi:MAG: GumC family protein [Planctomycetota bacterium]|jgi:capsular exopolysaccharide synthesis family protein
MSTITPTRPSLPQPAAPRPRQAPPQVAARGIDPFRILRQNLSLFVATGLAGIALGFVLFLVLNRFFPLYRGQVTFEMRSGIDSGNELTSEDLPSDDLVLRLATTEASLLVARTVLESAVKDPDVQTTQWFRSKFIAPDGTPLIDEAVDDLEENIGTQLIRGSNLFDLVWAAREESDVPIVLNTIARKYIEKREALDNESYNNNIQVFNSELTQTERELDDLAQEIENFIREKGITTLTNPNTSQLAQALDELVERIAETNSALSMTQTAYVQVSAKLEGTIAPTEEDRAIATQNGAVRSHELAVLNSKTVLRQLREQYRDTDHWLIRKEEQRMRAMELEYEAKLQEIMTSNLQAHLKEIAKQRESLLNMLEELEKSFEEKSNQMKTLAADIANYQEMEQKRDHLIMTRDTNNDLLKELRLMRLRADAKRVVVAQAALTPRQRSFPKIYIVIPAVTFFGLAIVGGLAFLRELTDQTVKGASDLVAVPGARVLGMIPELLEDPCKSDAAELVVRRCPNSVLAESYRQACTLIDKTMTAADHQTLLLVGGLPESGTTTVATNLAAAAAAVGKRVIVIDANFRRPRLAQAMGVDESGPGLGDVLAGDLPGTDAITVTEYGVDIMKAGTPEKRIFERLNNGQFDALIGSFRDRYDLVLVDAPPVVVSGDALGLASKLDAAILIVRANREQRGLVARLIHQLGEAHCELLGIVLNRPRGTAGGYFKKNFKAMAKYVAQEA